MGFVIDLSHNNGPISLHQAKDEGCEGAFLKCTEGTSFVDPSFGALRSRTEEVYQELKGGYHFADTGSDGNAQARHYLKNLGDRSDVHFCVVDVERSPLSNWEALDPSKRWPLLKSIYEPIVETGHKTLNYASPAWWNQFLAPFVDHDWLRKYVGLWTAEYGVTTPKGNLTWSQWEYWQYSESETVGGCVGVDCSRAC